MRAFGLVFLGILTSQVIAAILPLVLTRFLDPIQMGIIAGITAVVGVVGGIAHLRFANVINIADDAAEALALERGSIIITLILSFATFLVMLLLPLHQDWGRWGYFIPAWMLTTGLFTARTEYFVFKKDYQQYSLINVLRSVVTVLLHLPIIWFGGVLIPLLAKTLGELVPFFFFRRENLPPAAAVKPVLKKHLPYALNDTPIYLLTLMAKNLVFFVVGSVYGLATLGVFSIGYKVFKIPLSVVGESLKKVLERKFKDHVENQPRLRSLLYRSMGGMALAAVLLGLGIYFLIHPAFQLIFDERWLAASDYVIALIPAMALHLVSAPYQSAFKVKGKMKVLTQMQLLQSVLVVVALWWGASQPALSMVWAFSLAWALSFFYLPLHDFWLNTLSLRSRR